MAQIWLLYRVNSEDRNSSGIHSVLVDAANESAARTLAISSAPTGEAKIQSTFAAVQIAASGSLPVNPLYFEGDAASITGFRGA